jgi:uncharacterized membrane protein
VRNAAVVARQLLAMLGAVVAILVILAIPDAKLPDTASEPIVFHRGRIVELIDAEPLDPDDPGAGLSGEAAVLLLDGPDAGQQVQAFLQGPSGSVSIPDYRVGDDVVVVITGEPESEFIAVADRWRVPILGWLAVGFAILVVAVAGARGLRALLALILTIALIVKVVVPQLLLGAPPIPLAVGIAAVVTVIAIGLTEGISRTSLAAIAGTIAALVLTAVLGAFATTLAQFTAAAGSDLIYLQSATSGGPDYDVRGLLLAAFIFGALGVLDDVTVTQAATVDELADKAGLRGAPLFWSALNVGRSHIAATVNTLFLAYVGAALPLVVLFALLRQPASFVLNDEVIAVEVVRTIVGSVGILAAVPLTTLIATLVRTWEAPPRRPRSTDWREMARPTERRTDW